jgi:MFS family permease
MLFVRSKMPESRLWQEFKRRENAGELPPEKLAQSSPMVEIFKGVSLRYVIVGVIITGGYIIAYQCISIFMPTLILRDLGGNLGALRSITLWFAAISAVGMIGAGYLSDAWGRRNSIIVCTLVGIAGLIAIHSASAVKFPGDYMTWGLFWAYCLWGFGQGSIGQFGPWFAELYPVEMRNTATSTIFNIGRLVGAIAPYVVPVLAVSLGSLRDAMMLGIAGAAISLVLTFFLPETVGRTFAVIEDKERAATG